jgi:hypothetical protein
MGMQNGYNSKVVGRFVKTQGKIIPVVADPQMDQFLPKDFEKLQTFGAEQDLLKLAMMKYQLRDQFTNQIDLYDCFYRVSDRGIDLKLESKSKVLLQMHRSPEELRGGVRKNKLVVDGGSQSPSLEISGLFFTDLSSIPSTDEILTSGSPTVTVLPFKGVDSQKVNCFKDKAERNEVINKMEQDFRNRTQEI